MFSLCGSHFSQAVNYCHYKINKFRSQTWTTPSHWRTGCEVTVDRNFKTLARVNLTMHCPELRAPPPTQKKKPASPGNSSPEITGPHTKTEEKIRKKNIFWDNSFSPNIWSQKHFFNSKSLFHTTVTLTPSFQGNCCSLFRACVTLHTLSTERHSFLRFISWSCSLNSLTPTDTELKIQLMSPLLQQLLDLRKYSLFLLSPPPQHPLQKQADFSYFLSPEGCVRLLRHIP